MLSAETVAFEWNCEGNVSPKQEQRCKRKVEGEAEEGGGSTDVHWDSGLFCTAVNLPDSIYNMHIFSVHSYFTGRLFLGSLRGSESPQ